LKIYLTGTTYKELKKVKGQEEKISYLDVNKMIVENFSQPIDLSDTQMWIFNKMLLKKIDGFFSSNTPALYLYLKNPTCDTLKALSELMEENDLDLVSVELLR